MIIKIINAIDIINSINTITIIIIVKQAGRGCGAADGLRGATHRGGGAGAGD